MSVSQALRSRISTRAYTDEPVSENMVRDILDAARWAPSGSNMQPWKVICLSGADREAVGEIARESLVENPIGEEGEYPVYPIGLPGAYNDRRSQVAQGRYELLGIAREDRAAREAMVARNYDFWGAPVGVFFVIDRAMGHSQWAHLGMFMQSVMLVAEQFGLATCMQEAWAKVRKTLHQHFQLPENEMIYCGMALGHADRTEIVNTFRSTRIQVDEFASFRGF